MRSKRGSRLIEATLPPRSAGGQRSSLWIGRPVGIDDLPETPVLPTIASESRHAGCTTDEFAGVLERNWGRIIFISSESGLVTPGEMIHYGMTKTAQLAISRGLAALTKGTKVTMNSVLPGPTRSEGILDFLKSIACNPEAPLGEIEADV
jgi:NAD(P)-dependent dehydrogenase (short-subunit alcohol dehydrogenase family)